MEHVRVAIVGSGFAGLAMAIRLLDAGERDLVVLERRDDVGGTWRDNTYPGVACDVPSHLYSFSFAPNPSWSSAFSPGWEIQEYLRGVARDFGIYEHLRTGCELQQATWDDDARRWVLETSAGPLSCEVLIAAMGPLSHPRTPDIPGLEDFRGTAFHSARWDHGHDLRGRRVAVIGTGASAIQLVPRIASEVAALHLFQRTPAWIVPRRDRSLTAGERRLYRQLPGAQLAVRAGIYWARELLVLGLSDHTALRRTLERAALGHLRRQIHDPDLRRRLTPSYALGCKRILLSSDFYPALERPNVELVTDPIRVVRAGGVVTADGAEREVDTIIYATGFHVTDMPVGERVRGRDGRRLADHWAGSPQAYKGTVVTGFPNLFLLVGPNTGLGHNSIVFMIESQVSYIADLLGRLRRRGIAVADVRPEVQHAYNVDIQRRLERTVWVHGGCTSWYLDGNGRNATLWPGFTWPFRRTTRAADLGDYDLRPVRAAPEAVPTA